MIFERDGKWYFLNEIEDEYGPYDSEDEARETFKRYCDEYL